MQRDNFTCQCCGDETTELNVHHKRYDATLRVWEYDNNELVTICEHCHSFLHYLLLFKFDNDIKKLSINDKLPTICKRYFADIRTYFIYCFFDNNVLVTAYIEYDEDNEYFIEVGGVYNENSVKSLLGFINKHLNG